MPSLTFAGAATASAVVALAIGHAVLESRAYDAVTRGKANPPLENASVDALWLASALGVLALEVTAVAVAAQWTGPPHAWRLALVATGALAVAFGILLRTRTIRELGRAFAVPPDQGYSARLLTDGVFRAARHPSELGLLLMCTGFTAIAPAKSTIGILAVAVVPLMAARIAREERALRSRFGMIHADYCRATPLFWPAASHCPQLIRHTFGGNRQH